MKMMVFKLRVTVLGLVLSLLPHLTGQPQDEVDILIGALLADTPLEEDLLSLTDTVGGRPTGSEANRLSVEWALGRFQEAGVSARREEFNMPALWIPDSASVAIGGDVSFKPRVVAKPYSATTAPSTLKGNLLDGGFGTPADFARLGPRVHGAFVLIETNELHDLDGLFREYREAADIERRASSKGMTGLIYMSSRPRNLLYRHNAALGPSNKKRLLVMEREGAKRALRLLRAGADLQIHVKISASLGGSYRSENVIAEIPGSEKPDEYVLIGAHLDSWDLGTGALDNGCNVALVIDLARQIRRLGLKPRRTLRFALFNGEEQGLHGSWGYVRTHAAELDGHVMASSFDMGSGRISGFFTNGRTELIAAVDEALRPVRGLGPFSHPNVPVVGTDNYDFMMEGVANLVAMQEDSNYGPNYHARSDTFDKVDLRQLRLNAAIAAALIWGFSETDVSLRRHTRAEIEELIRRTDLGDQMRAFALWDSWERGVRGRK